MSNTKTKRVPKKYKENFIFDFVDNFNEYNFAQANIGEYLYLINIYGKCISKIKCEDLSVSNNAIKLNGKWGILYESKLVIPAIYDKILRVSDNCFEVGIDEKSGLIDSQNNFIIEPKYDSLYHMGINDLFLAKINEKWGVIDTNLSTIIPFKYDTLYPGEFKKNKNKLVAIKDNKYGVINLKNEIIIPFEYEELHYITYNTLVAKKSDNECILINDKNEQICKYVFEDLQPYYDIKKSMLAAKHKGLYGFIDKYGNTKIDFQYTDVGIPFEGYCEVSKSAIEMGDNYGYINAQGNLILPFEYANYSIYAINKNRFIARKNSYTGIVDKNNNKIADFIFDYIAVSPTTKDNEFFPSMINQKAGFINQNGEPLIIDKKSLKNAGEIMIKS